MHVTFDAGGCFTRRAFTARRRKDGGTLNQQAGRVEHLPLVTVGPARVRPSVISGDAEDGQAAIVDLKRQKVKLSGGTRERTRAGSDLVVSVTCDEGLKLQHVRCVPASCLLKH